MGNERICGDENVRAGNEYRHEQGSEALKERFEALFVVVVQDGESRKRLSDCIVECRRYPPHASVTFTQLYELARRILNQPVRRVSHDGMNRIRSGILQPLEGVAENDSGASTVSEPTELRVCRPVMMSTGYHDPTRYAERLTVAVIPLHTLS